MTAKTIPVPKTIRKDLTGRTFGPLGCAGIRRPRHPAQFSLVVSLPMRANNNHRWIEAPPPKRPCEKLWMR
jgi:hypothetical protein